MQEPASIYPLQKVEEDFLFAVDAANLTCILTENLNLLNISLKSKINDH